MILSKISQEILIQYFLWRQSHWPVNTQEGKKSAPQQSRGLCKPQKGIVPANLSRGTENLPLTSLAPQSVNGRCLSTINFLDNSKVVDLFSLRSMLETKAFLLSPAELGAHFAKAYNKKSSIFADAALSTAGRFEPLAFGGGILRKNRIGQNPRIKNTFQKRGCLFAFLRKNV